MDRTVLALTRELIKRPSVSPEDGGCQALISGRLEKAGFTCEQIDYGEVRNLWAWRGQGAPLLLLLGHTDVVPTGPVDEWRHPPFAAVEEEGRLYGRGSADMKSGVAAMVLAMERFVAARPDFKGRLGLLLTSDEEGPAVDGVQRVIEHFVESGESIDYCLVGEPSSREQLGDQIKIGRRGSINARVTVRGIQGHVAYPERARNPIHEIAPLLEKLIQTSWDEGGQGFPPTTMQITNVHSGTGTDNVVPGSAEFELNFRYGTVSSADQLQQRFVAILEKELIDFEVEWKVSGAPFCTGSGLLLDAVDAAVRRLTGGKPRHDTSGGTSDGRFVAPTGAEVIEFGPVGETIHKVDEWVAADDLEPLARCYQEIFKQLLPA